MIKDLATNDQVKQFLKNELRSKRESGTYLFYGNDSDKLLSIAIALSKGLCCTEMEDDFCDQCNTCHKIDKLVYSDLEIIDDPTGIKVDDVRELIQKSSAAPFEGKNKVFILRNIQNMKKEASNALLKLIEEPGPGNYYIMLTKSMNILPTIKSRSVILHIRPSTAEELGVTPGIYDFFIGLDNDIESFKNGQYDIKDRVPFMEIGEHINKYVTSGDFQSKIYMYGCIRDFIENRSYAGLQDKIYFVETILRECDTREAVKEIIAYTVKTMGYLDGLKERLTLKAMTRYPVNMKLVLFDLFINL